MDVTITPAAEKFIRRMLRFGGGPQAGFRLVVSEGGCSGLAGDFTVETAPLPGDEAFDIAGVKLFLPAQSRQLLTGVTIDFADTPTKTGLVFHDPKTAAKACSSSQPQPIATIAISSITHGRRH